MAQTNVKPIPEGYHSLTPYLHIRNAARAIEFYKNVFKAEELLRMPGAGEDSVGHAELKFGDSILMLADEVPEWGIQSPQSLGGNGSSLMLYVPDVDAVFERAVKAGATVVRPLENKFYGDRAGTVADPFGHQWTIATHVEDVPEDELARRAEAEMQKMSSGSS